MHFLLSPAKTLDFERTLPPHAATRPQFVAQSRQLIDVLQRKTPQDISDLMHLSPALAQLNVDRYRAWSTRFTEHNSRPAIWAFNGDVYEGLDAASLDEAEIEWAQRHVSILSGLYGVLRPLDRMQAYRLEMGTALTTQEGRNLYEFWGDTLAAHLNRRVAKDESSVIVNLASQEYFRAADRRALRPRVIECVFEDWKNDQYKVISFFTKRARGLMLRHAIQARLTSPEGLESFHAEGYGMARKVSTPDRLVFRRRV